MIHKTTSFNYIDNETSLTLFNGLLNHYIQNNRYFHKKEIKMKTYFRVHNSDGKITYVEESPLDHSCFRINDIVTPIEFDLKCFVKSFEFNFNTQMIFINLYPVDKA